MATTARTVTDVCREAKRASRTLARVDTDTRNGALEAIAVLLSMDRQLIPPTAGLVNQDPEIHLDVVTGEPRPWTPSPALSNSFGFGGHNGCLVISPPS